MRYQSGTAFRAALETRLNQIAARDPTTLMRLRKLVVFERLLARLLVVAPDRWVIKGGVALDLRLGVRARATKDLDLGRQDSVESAAEDLHAVTSTDLGDYFAFTVEQTDDLEDIGDGVAARYRVQARLAGRRFENVVLDIGFGNPLPTEPDRLYTPGLLSFAGFEPIVVPALPLEQHVAEKVHAYTRSYRSDQSSSRVKDLIDLILIRSVASFEANRLRRAIVDTFANRGLHNLPLSLPPPPPAWALAYPKMARAVDLDTDMATGHKQAAEFLDPILSGQVRDSRRWNQLLGAWVPSSDR
jgi:hypothetical protein